MSIRDIRFVLYQYIMIFETSREIGLTRFKIDIFVGIPE